MLNPDFSATQLATSTTGSLQSSLETETAERKTQDEKISKSIGAINNTLLGYIGSRSINNLADGTIRGAIGNNSIAGIGTENNITSAINGLHSSLSTLSTNLGTVSTSLESSNKSITKNATAIDNLRTDVDKNTNNITHTLSDKGIVSDTLIATTQQGIYRFDKTAKYNPNTNSAGVIYTTVVSATNSTILLSVRLMVTTGGDVYTSVYVSGSTWGSWRKIG